jgi:hypothetical protein
VPARAAPATSSRRLAAASNAPGCATATLPPVATGATRRRTHLEGVERSRSGRLAEVTGDVDREPHRAPDVVVDDEHEFRARPRGSVAAPRRGSSGQRRGREVPRDTRRRRDDVGEVGPSRRGAAAGSELWRRGAEAEAANALRPAAVGPRRLPRERRGSRARATSWSAGRISSRSKVSSLPLNRPSRAFVPSSGSKLRSTARSPGAKATRIAARAPTDSWDAETSARATRAARRRWRSGRTGGRRRSRRCSCARSTRSGAAAAPAGGGRRGTARACR